MILQLAEDPSYGASRQMLIYGLWRVKLDQAEQVLTIALADPDVALHAGSALRRMIGNERAIERLIGLADANDERVARAAQRNLKLPAQAVGVVADPGSLTGCSVGVDSSARAG